MISLMFDELKIFLKIINNRILKKCLEEILTVQFGFRRGIGEKCYSPYKNYHKNACPLEKSPDLLYRFWESFR